MMSQLEKCKSHELKAGLTSAKLLCGKSSGYGSGSREHEDMCKEAPSGLVKVCKDAQAKCMALKEAVKVKVCIDAAVKDLMEKAENLDFCDKAPSHLMSLKCKHEK